MAETLSFAQPSTVSNSTGSPGTSGLGARADHVHSFSDTGYTPTSVQVIAGAGLTGGGALSTDVTLNVAAADTSISVSANAIAVALSTTASGLAVSAGLMVADSVAGSGLTIASKVLAVGAGNGLTVNADDVALTTPGTLSISSTNVSSGNHTHAVTASANPGAAAALLASSTDGYLQLVRLYPNQGTRYISDDGTFLTVSAGIYAATVSKFGDTVQFAAGSQTAPASGKGVEIAFNNSNGRGIVMSFDRDGGVYKDLYLYGNTTIIGNAGLQIGAPTGGDKGGGTLNVQAAIYQNGAAYPHTALGSIGTNTHAQIDTHLGIADITAHSLGTKAQVSIGASTSVNVAIPAQTHWTFICSESTNRNNCSSCRVISDDGNIRRMGQEDVGSLSITDSALNIVIVNGSTTAITTNYSMIRTY